MSKYVQCGILAWILKQKNINGYMGKTQRKCAVNSIVPMLISEF